MSQPPLMYSTPQPQSADDGHLRALAICHYVWGGLTLLFSLIFIFYIVLGVMFTSGAIPLNPPQAVSAPTTSSTSSGTVIVHQRSTTFRSGVVTISSPSNAPLPNSFGYFFIGMGSGMLFLGWTMGILTIISGLSIAKRRRRVFSLVIAGINCASLPFGTLLGVFTFIVLLRASVKAMYETPRPD